MKLRIASYNIRKAVGLDWKRKPDRIIAVIAEIDADIVLLQEADRRLGSRAGVLPIEELRHSLDYEIADVATRPLSHGWHGNAILFRKALSLVSARRLELPRAEPRGAVSGSFDVGRSQPLQVISAHLSLLKTFRRRQYRALGQQVGQESGGSFAVIGGDFNDRSSDAGIRHCFGENFQVVSPGPSFHTKYPVWSLDRFVVGDEVEAKADQVHSSDLARRASDHLPIYVDIEV